MNTTNTLKTNNKGEFNHAMETEKALCKTGVYGTYK
jgi:hypothetical protein